MMKPDYAIAIILTRVTHIGALTLEAISDNNLEEAKELVQLELNAFQEASKLVNQLEGEKFKQFFPIWIPERISQLETLLAKLESRLPKCNN